MEIDHLFILCDVGAPEAAALIEAGLLEGSSNVHPGQGTACRRFFFETSYLELLWVGEHDDAQSEAVRGTGLWERWTRRHNGGSPFGVALRPDAFATASLDPPFATMTYRPAYLPPGASFGVATDVPSQEPAFFWLPFQRNRARLAREPTTHWIGGSITHIRIGSPSYPPASEAARIVSASALLTFERADDHVVELTIDEARTGSEHDLQPRLPLKFRW